MPQKQPYAHVLQNSLKVAGAYNFIKKRLQHSCFPVNISKFLRTTFFIELLRWLPLITVKCLELMAKCTYVFVLSGNDFPQKIFLPSHNAVFCVWKKINVRN